MTNAKPILPAIALVVLGFLAFYPTLAGGFLWDDHLLITQNNLITSPGRLWMLWFSTVPYDYFPLTYSTFWLEYRLVGDSPLVYRITNLLLHLASALVFWRILLRLGMSPGAAFTAAAVWAVHPIHLQSVAWIAERKNTLSLFFGMLAARAFLERGRWLWLSVPLFAAACLAKTSLAPLPAVLAVLWWWHTGFFTKDRRRVLAAMFAISLVLSVVTIYYQSQHAIATDIVRDDSLLSRLLIAARAVWFYAGTTLFPFNLNFAHPRWPTGADQFANILPFAALAVAGGFLVAFRRQPWALATLVLGTCYILMLSPVLGFFDIYFMKYSLVSEHWQYPAGPILIAGVVAAAAHLKIKPAAAAVTVSGLLAALVVRAHLYAPTYLSEESLWASTARRTPNLTLARDNLSAELLAKRRLDEAASHITASLDLDPTSHRPWTNLARLSELRKDDIDALAAYQQARHLGPADPDTAFNLGQILARLHQPAAARAAFEDALRLNPSHPLALNNLAMLLWQQGDTARAELLFRQQIEVNHTSVPARVNLATLLATTGRLDEARNTAEAAFQLSPTHIPTLNLLGGIAKAQGDLPAAEQHFRQAAQLAPQAFEPLKNLALLLAQTHRPQEAAQVAARALKLNPSDESLKAITLGQ
jgi:Flp pilus assembly protein TadD